MKQGPVVYDAVFRRTNSLINNGRIKNTDIRLIVDVLGKLQWTQPLASEHSYSIYSIVTQVSKSQIVFCQEFVGIV
jgi:hypothetical protein